MSRAAAEEGVSRGFGGDGNGHGDEDGEGGKSRGSLCGGAALVFGVKEIFARGMTSTWLVLHGLKGRSIGRISGK